MTHYTSSHHIHLPNTTVDPADRTRANQMESILMTPQYLVKISTEDADDEGSDWILLCELAIRKAFNLGSDAHVELLGGIIHDATATTQTFWVIGDFTGPSSTWDSALETLRNELDDGNWEGAWFNGSGLLTIAFNW